MKWVNSSGRGVLSVCLIQFQSRAKFFLGALTVEREDISSESNNEDIIKNTTNNACGYLAKWHHKKYILE